MKKGIILINPYTKNQSILDQGKRMYTELSKLGFSIQIVRNNKFSAYVAGESLKLNHPTDFGVVFDKDKYIPKMLEKAGVKLFNSSKAIELCDDKMLTHIELSNNGINMPITLGASLCYGSEAEIEEEYYDNIEKILGYPMIIKSSFGSMGKEVFLIEDRQRLIAKDNQLKLKPHLYQKYIKTSHGTDIRLIVIGGKAVAWMKRVSKNDFRSNIELGGIGLRVELDAEYKAMGEKVAKILNLDYCGIDLLTDNHGKPILCEVNSNAFFGGIESVSGVNVAGLYAEHIYNNIK